MGDSASQCEAGVAVRIDVSLHRVKGKVPAVVSI